MHCDSGTWGTCDKATRKVKLPPALPLSMQSIDPKGAYVLDIGEHVVLYLGARIGQGFLAEVFGCEEATGKVEVGMLKVDRGSLAARIAAVLGALGKGDGV